MFIDEGYKKLANINEALPSKGNNMELFHFLSAGPYGPRVINYALSILRKNLKDIEVNKHFLPDQKHLSAFQLDLNSDPHIHQQAIP